MRVQAPATTNSNGVSLALSAISSDLMSRSSSGVGIGEFWSAETRHPIERAAKWRTGRPHPSYPYRYAWCLQGSWVKRNPIDANVPV